MLFNFVFIDLLINSSYTLFKKENMHKGALFCYWDIDTPKSVAKGMSNIIHP